MGNECCTPRGALEPLENYFGVPLTTLCTYEAGMLGLEGPTPPSRFHVAMVDATSSSGAGGASVGAQQVRLRHHDVPLLVLSVASQCHQLAGIPNLQQWVAGAAPQWLGTIRLALNHTFVTDQKQWLAWCKKCRSTRKKSQGGDRAIEGQNPIMKALSISQADGVRCLSLLAFFLKQLPAPLLSPVMVTELEAVVTAAQQTLPDSDATSLQAAQVEAFVRVWHSTIAASYPTEHATLECIAETLYSLASSDVRRSTASRSSTTTRSYANAIENDAWRGAVDIFLRRSDLIRSFSGGTTRPNRAANSTRATEDMLYGAVADGVFCIVSSRRRRDEFGGGTTGNTSSLAVHVDPAATSGESAELPTGGSADPPDAGVTSRRSHGGKNESHQPTTDRNGQTSITMADASGAQGVGGVGVTAGSSSGGSVVLAVRTISPSPTNSESPPASTTSRNRGDAVNSITAAAESISSDAFFPKSGSPLVHESMASALVSEEGHGPLHVMVGRSRQSSVALSALTNTPRHLELQPAESHQQGPASNVDVPCATNASATQAGGQRAQSTAHRLELAKAAFSQGIDIGAHRLREAEVNRTEVNDDEPLQQQSSIHATDATSTSVAPHGGRDEALPTHKHSAFMVDATEAIASLQQEVVVTREEQRRCATLLQDALPHRGFREQTQRTLEELASHGADLGDEVLRLQKQLAVLQQQFDAANKDRDRLAAEAAAARFSASEVILKFADMERAQLHHDQSLRYLERKMEDYDDSASKRDTVTRTLRVDVDALQRRVLCLRDHI